MNDADKVQAIRADIPFLLKGVYADNASVSPISRRVQAAGEAYGALIVHQLREARDRATPVFDKGRALAAALVGSTPDKIAYIQNTSHGLSLVALGLDWRKGDNLVVCAQEFPSNYLCWTQLAAKGVEIRQAPAADGRLDVDALRGLMDARTRVVAVSHVQFYSGYRVDLAALGEVCARSGALLVVDGTQSVGAIRLDVAAAGVDVLAASAHKWMMGPRGIGFAAFSDRALSQIRPAIVGWLSVNDPFAFHRTHDYLPDARRFEPGTPNGSGIFGLAERLAEIEEAGVDWIENRILALHGLLCERALSKGLQPLYRFERARRAGITLLQKPGVSAQDMNARLAAQGVFASIRNGAVRIAAHYYNTEDEIERVVSAMAD